MGAVTWVCLTPSVLCLFKVAISIAATAAAAATTTAAIATTKTTFYGLQNDVSVFQFT